MATSGGTRIGTSNESITEEHCNQNETWCVSIQHRRGIPCRGVLITNLWAAYRNTNTTTNRKNVRPTFLKGANNVGYIIVLIVERHM